MLGYGTRGCPQGGAAARTPCTGPDGPDLQSIPKGYPHAPLSLRPPSDSSPPISCFWQSFSEILFLLLSLGVGRGWGKPGSRTPRGSTDSSRLGSGQPLPLRL